MGRGCDETLSDFWEGDATKHSPMTKKGFSVKRGRHSVNEGFGKDLYRQGNSVKRSGPFSEPPGSDKDRPSLKGTRYMAQIRNCWQFFPEQHQMWFGSR